MKIYTCGNCHNLLYFENNICLSCGHNVGFDPMTLSLLTLIPEDETSFSDILDKSSVYQYCKNAEHGVCNWLITSSQHDPYCKACSLNHVIPSLTNEENLKRWKKIEEAKHRLIYSLLRLQLPIDSKTENEETGLAFDFMANVSSKERVMTGHDNGTITLNIEEGDEVEQVQHKLNLGEKYRTLLGHFRHEIGHYYWDTLIKNSKLIGKFRKLFGDEQKDYATALETYYKDGPIANWNEHYISPYATSHAWEDWAETWAHYLHMMDTLETAYAFGIRVDPAEMSDDPANKVNIKSDPYEIAEFGQIVKKWLPLSFALNSLNRSMGYGDFYPFIISSPMIEKLKFIHELCFSYSQQNKIIA